jgi:glycosyltransferase involved in cell wall biosynthesis
LFSDDLFCTKYPKLKVALVGINSLSEIGVHINNVKRFVAIPYLQPPNLEYLFSQACFFVSTSFHEGFGYAPIEAMSYFTPSLVSNNTAMPEICGDAAIYCDPFDIDSIIVGIKTILISPPSKEAIQDRLNFITRKQNEDTELLSDLICIFWKECIKL